MGSGAENDFEVKQGALINEMIKTQLNIVNCTQIIYKKMLPSIKRGEVLYLKSHKSN